MVKLAGVESAMVYSCDHNGNCYYPAKRGHLHANLKGRDIFGETVSLLRKEGIVPIAYYTSIYHNDSAKNHPAWRMAMAGGSQHSGRYWWSCPNNEDYVEFAISQVQEVVAYDVDGLFNDMTFWPGICLCHACREKFLAETGLEIPAEVDWRNKEWIAFQRFRERSMAKFSQRITDAAKAVRKDITVTHQTSLIMAGWLQGYTLDLAAACDYTSGDFYGGKGQHILGAKVMAAASKNLPYEFMTSRCVNLRDHTSMKSEDGLLAEASTTLINGGAYFFIDAINPDGTLEEEVYKRLSSVSAKLHPFREALKRHSPELHAGVALYYSSASYVGDGSKAHIMSDVPPEVPAVAELSGMADILTRNHIPFKVVNAKTPSFKGLGTIILNNIAYLEPDEVERLKTFVAEGGTLIATGNSSLFDADGATSGNFALSEVFGVNTTGKDSTSYNYLSFVGRHWLVSCNAPAPLVKASTAKVLAKIVEPVFAPEAEKYASIHSNPPGRETEFAALTVNSYGKGRCVYLASSLLSMKQDAQREFGAWLLKEFMTTNVSIETNAPPCVEAAVLRSSTADAWLVGFVNYQAELPNVPVHGLRAELPLHGRNLSSCVRISDGAKLQPKIENGSAVLEVEKLDTIEMFELSFKTTGDK